MGERTLVNKEFKDTQREKSRPGRTPGLTKSLNMNIWIVGAVNQLFKGGSYNKIKLSKKKVVSGKTLLLVIGPFYTPHSICLNTGF